MHKIKSFHPVEVVTDENGGIRFYVGDKELAVESFGVPLMDRDCESMATISVRVRFGRC